ncbi:MAG: ribosomal protein S18-alanine N-acetyltransferase [Thermoplasmatota archaeon]
MKNEDMNIRRIRQSDLDRVRTLANQMLRETYTEELMGHLFERFQHCFLVAASDEDICGFILGVPLDNLTLRILMIAVEKKYQRKGIGTNLLMAARRYAALRKMNSITLEVGIDNEGAQKFYQTQGFSITGLLENYYQDKTDAYVMRSYLVM